jgi:hypothetical protein
MAQISVGAAVGSGFGLIASRPLSVVAWGLIPTVLQVIAIALVAPIYLNMWTQMVGSIAAGGSAMPPVMAMQPQLRQVQGLVQLINLAQLFISAVVYCAVFRAVLHPGKSAFAYLRVGAAELFLALLTFAAFIVLIVAMIVVMIPIGILIAIVAVTSHGAGAGYATIIPIVVLVVLIGILVVGLRFSFVGPMMVEDDRFHLFESWSLTRGRMGSLLLIVLCLIGILLAFEVVILALLVGVSAAAVGSVGGINQVTELFQHSPQALLARVWPFLAVYGVLMVPVSGCMLAIVGAPFARAYRDVAVDPAGTSATFA